MFSSPSNPSGVGTIIALQLMPAAVTTAGLLGPLQNFQCIDINPFLIVAGHNLFNPIIVLVSSYLSHLFCMTNRLLFCAD